MSTFIIITIRQECIISALTMPYTMLKHINYCLAEQSAINSVHDLAKYVGPQGLGQEKVTGPAKKLQAQ